MICIYFRDYPDDVFADGEQFDNKEEASEWFNPQYHAWRKSGAKVTTIKEWPQSEDIEPVYQGEFVKGYKVERKGEEDLWILITKEV